jgi:hypothetical protein
MTAPVPLHQEDVTAAWLSDALSGPQGRTVVRTLTHDELVRGAGTKVRIRVTYDSNPRKVPDVLWVKAGWEDHSPMMEEMGVYTREAVFYGDFLPQMTVRAPACYFAAYDGHGRSVVVLEDLIARGAELWACTQPRSGDDMRKLLESLAGVHACFWENRSALDKHNIGVLVEPTGPKAVWPRANGGERLRGVLSGPRGDLMPAYARDPERVEKIFWRMVDALERPNGSCLLHGDPHPGNCFSDADGGAGLYDWQAIARGPWAFDVGYSMTTALSVADRRYHERDLLAHYLKQLAALGVGNVPPFAEAWDDYRRFVAHPLFIWPTNHNTHQAEENIRALSERAGAAAADFRVFELWGV